METMELHKTITKFKDMAFSGRWRRDSGVKLFDVNTKTMLRVLSGHGAAILACDFVCNRTGATGTGLVSWVDDKTIKLWDLLTEIVVDTFTGHSDYVRGGAACVEQPDLVVSGGYD
jgi:U3 small nucleolar RNA-associated protein 15